MLDRVPKAPPNEDEVRTTDRVRVHVRRPAPILIFVLVAEDGFDPTSVELRPSKTSIGRVYLRAPVEVVRGINNAGPPRVPAH
ncbi:Ff.00g065110.m01.CDS01 [Fusarium sp. VM40]|nr:Ff.00g065110.m01.CDS01 [Fusarium sp. VM40]